MLLGIIYYQILQHWNCESKKQIVTSLSAKKKKKKKKKKKRNTHTLYIYIYIYIYKTKNTLILLLVIVYYTQQYWNTVNKNICSSPKVTIQVRRTRHAGHCWRSKDELISDVLLWTPTYGCARVGRPAWTYIQDTGCNPEDLPEAMNDREKWRERVKDIRAGGATWWWWWLYIYINIYIYIYIYI